MQTLHEKFSMIRTIQGLMYISNITTTYINTTAKDLLKFLTEVLHLRGLLAIVLSPMPQNYTHNPKQTNFP